jgi:hypothetical protein
MRVVVEYVQGIVRLSIFSTSQQSHSQPVPSIKLWTPRPAHLSR